MVESAKSPNLKRPAFLQLTRQQWLILLMIQLANMLFNIARSTAYTFAGFFVIWLAFLKFCFWLCFWNRERRLLRLKPSQ